MSYSSSPITQNPCFACSIFLLLPLKRSLYELGVSDNPEINDDAITAFVMLSKLQYLSLMNTATTITGVRRLASALKDRGRGMELEIPASCEEYLNRKPHIDANILKLMLHSPQRYTRATSRTPARRYSRIPKLSNTCPFLVSSTTLLLTHLSTRISQPTALERFLRNSSVNFWRLVRLISMRANLSG